jgi:hypothetical protein
MKQIREFFKSIGNLLSLSVKRIIGSVLLIKFLIFVFGLCSYQLLNEKSLTSSYWLFGIWNRWDAGHYLNIAQFGYTAVGERRFDIAFFPLYPALVSVFIFLTGNEILSAFLVSGIASVALGVLFYHLVKTDFDEDTAMSAVWLLFVFPTAYFLHIPYTESLFLALVVGSFLFARKGNWLLAGILGFLACTTRINGLILCLALPFEILIVWRATRRFDWRWLWLGLIPLGFVFYLLLNYYVTGSSLAFLDVQREHWGKHLDFPWKSIWKQILYVRIQQNSISQMFGLMELLFIGIGFFSTVLGWRHLRVSYRVWMIANWLLFVSTSWLLSVPRYTLTMFPIFILFALASKNWLAKTFITAWSILFLALFIISFVQGRWGF